jgi:SEC-C motif-containing protein
MTACPCGSNQAFALCCAPYLEGRCLAPTAEALMRSRYTAYTLMNLHYLRKTDGSESRGAFSDPRALSESAQMTWLGLTVVRVIGGGETDRTGEVVYIARYRDKGGEKQLTEHAVFRKTDHAWYYAGPLKTSPSPADTVVAKVGRNAPCPCGSGEKYKRCCGN